MSGRKLTVLVASVATILSTAAIIAPAADAKPKAKPPAKVSKARVATVSRNAATITWKNPKSKNFKATVVRIAPGTKAPKSAKAGRAVATVSKKRHAVAITRLAAGTTYTVGLFSSDGKKHYSKVVAVRVRTAAAPKPKPKPKPKPVDHTAPAAVKNVQVAIADGKAHLTWTPPSDADFKGVQIYRTASAGGTGVKVAADTTAPVKVGEVAKGTNSFDDKTIEAGKTYTYDVRAQDKAGNTTPAPKDEQESAAGGPVVSQVTAPSVERDTSDPSTSAKLSWTVPSPIGDFKGVRIVRKTGAAAPTTATDGVAVGDVDSAQTTKTDAGLAAGTQYTYAFFGYNADGVATSAAAPTAALTTKGGPVTRAVATVVDDKSIKITWTNPVDPSFTGVKIVRKLDSAPTSDSDGTVVKDVAKPTTSYTDTALDAGTTYYYGLFAHTSAPEYAASASTSATTKTVATKPPAITGTVTRADTHKPVAGVTVEAHRYGALVKSAKTDASGHYAITGLPANQYFQLVFDGSTASNAPTGGLQDGYADDVRTSASTVTDKVDQELEIGAAVKGVVTSDSQPLKNVVVTVFEKVNEEDGYFYDSVSESRTDADGKYLVPGLSESNAYAVCFDASKASGGTSTTGYATECYQDKPSDNGSPTDDYTAVITHVGIETTANASLSTGGGVTGTVTAAAGSAPVANVDVYVFPVTDGYIDTGSPTTVTDAKGTFTVAGLTPGTSYGVCFGTSKITTGNGLAPQCYKNTAWAGTYDPGTVTPVKIVSGDVTKNVDAVLAKGALISGTVFGGDSATKLAGVGVQVNQVVTGDDGDESQYSVLDTTTASNGTFAARNLAAGTYVVCFDSSTATGGFAGGYFDDCTDNITVATGNTSGGHDITLTKAAGLTGTVTAATGGGKLANVEVDVYDEEGDGQASTTTDANGSYSYVGRLKASDAVKICFDPSDATGGTSTTGYLQKCEAIKLTDGAVVKHDATLATAGAISGKVANSGGTPIEGASIVVVDSSRDDVSYATTVAGGTYTAVGVPTGDYFVCADARHVDTAPTGGYIPACVSNVTWRGNSYYIPAGAKTVHVTAGAITKNTDFALQVGGSISGTLTSQDGGGPLQGSVEIFDSSKQVVRYDDSSDDDGAYSVRGLPAGTYSVCFAPYNDDDYAPECYKDTAWDGDDDALPTGAASVDVKAMADTPGINGTAPKAASISGSVTGDGVGVSASLQVFDAAGEAVAYGSSDPDSDGEYRIGGLNPGQYRVCAHPDDDTYAPQCWKAVAWSGDSEVLPTDATVVTLGVGGAAPKIDFALVKPGTISGTVVSAKNSAAAQQVYVYAFDSNGAVVASENTYEEGKYTITVPAGTYRLCFDARYSYVEDGYEFGQASQCYSGKAWDGRKSTAVAAATTSVTLASGEAKVLDQVKLGPAGAASGTVTSGGSALSGVDVVVFDADGDFEKVATSEQDGTWTATGLTPGSHIVCYEGARGDDGSSATQLGYLDSCRSGQSWGGGIADEESLGYSYAPVPTTGTTPVSVTANKVTPEVNDSLAQAGAVSGTLTSAGKPLSSAYVAVFTKSGTLVASGYTDTNGAYVAPGLPTGSYWVCSDGRFGSGTGALPQCYNGKAWDGNNDVLPDGLTDVKVTAGKNTPGVNQTLTAAGAITGTVTGSTGDPDQNTEILVFDTAGNYVTDGYASDTGAYSVRGLQTGSYTVCFYSFGSGGHSECYANQPWSGDYDDLPAGAKPVAVKLGSATPKIDAQLEPSD